jgi:peroxiredoxin
MPLSKTYKILFISLLTVTLITYFFLSKPTAPTLTFKTITNKTINLQQLQGQPVLVTFWASNCPSCLKEISHFKDLYQNYHHRGLEIIAIAMHYDRPNYVVQASKIHQIPYDIVLDLRQKFALAFGDVSLTPTTILINPQGKIEQQITGTFDLADMQTHIESLLTPHGT